MAFENSPLLICTLDMKTTLPRPSWNSTTTTLRAKSDEILVKISFRHYHEIHNSSCKVDVESPDHMDHTVLSRKFDEDSLFVAGLMLPLKPETVEYYLVSAELDEYSPVADYVTPDIWDESMKRVAEFILKTADFDSKLGFEMVAHLEVVTVVGNSCVEEHVGPFYSHLDV